MVVKLSVDQMRRIAEIEEYQKIVDHTHHLVQELDSNRAAAPKVLDRICEQIARDMSKMRQRALTSNIGTVADVAGALAVMAGRGGGLMMKVRGLADGVNSLRLQLDHALKMASTPEAPKPPTSQ